MKKALSPIVILITIIKKRGIIKLPNISLGITTIGVLVFVAMTSVVELFLSNHSLMEV